MVILGFNKMLRHCRVKYWCGLIRCWDKIPGIFWCPSRFQFDDLAAQELPGLSEDAILAIINGGVGAGLAASIHLPARARVMRISGWIQLIMFTLHTGKWVSAASHNARRPQQFSGGWLHPPTTLSHLWHAQTQTRWRNMHYLLCQLSFLSLSLLGVNPFSWLIDHSQSWQSFTRSF